MKGQDAERLAKVLVKCPALVHLDLCVNHIGDDGVEVLYECFRSAQRSLISISEAITLEQTGQRVLQECWCSAQRWFTSISATIESALSGLQGREASSFVA